MDRNLAAGLLARQRRTGCWHKSQVRGQVPLVLNVRGRDLSAVANDLRDAIARGVVLEPGMSIAYSGQFEYPERAETRLKVVVPATLPAGLVPVVWASGSGAEVMSRIAAPMLGGMVTAPLLSLFVVPVVHALLRSRGT